MVEQVTGVKAVSWHHDISIVPEGSTGAETVGAETVNLPIPQMRQCRGSSKDRPRNYLGQFALLLDFSRVSDR
jgi:hypothetical protein